MTAKINTQMEARLNRITPTLLAVARKYEPATRETAEDIFQDMAYAILLKSTFTPAFYEESEYNDNYLVMTGAYQAMELRRQAKVYARHFATFEPDTDSEDFMDFIASDEDLEADTIAHFENEALSEALDKLPDNQITVVYLWATGYKSKEIAARLGVSASRISQIKAEAFASLKSAINP